MADSVDEIAGRLAAAEAEVAELRKFRAMVELGPEITWLIDRERRIVYCSPNREEVGNVAEGAPAMPLIHADDMARVEVAFREVLRSPPGTPIFVQARTRSGRERELVAVNRLDDPDLRGVLVVSRDAGPQNSPRKALQDAYERLALAASAAREYVWEWDVTNDQLIPSALFDPSGDTSTRLRSIEDFYARLADDDRDRVRAIFEGLLSRGESIDVEWRMREDDGSAGRWYRSTGQRLTDERGHVRIIGRTVDVHERKSAEIALRDSEQQFRSLFEATSSAVTLRDERMLTFLDCNDAALRLYGAKTREELRRTQPDHLAVSPQPDGLTAREKLEQMLKIARSEGSVRAEWLSRRLNGEIFFAEVRISLIHLARGPVWQTIIEDVTDRRHEEEAVRRRAARNEVLRDVSRRLLRESFASATPAILESAGAVLGATWIGLFDATDEAEDDATLWLSAAWTKPDHAASPPSSISLRAVPATVAVSPIRAGMRTIGVLAIEIATERSSGPATPSDELATLDSIAELIGIARAREQVEHAIARAKEDALAASRAKTAFLATMSHELRSPLNGVIGTVDLLAGTYLDERQKRYAEIARSSARSLLSVINDILDFTKIEAGHFEVGAVDFDVQELIDEAACIFALHAEEKRLALVCSVAPELHGQFIGDAPRIRQVLVNLIGNAVKFTPHGDVRVAATALDVAHSSLTLRVEVTDSGLGIDAAARERLFTPFTRLGGAGPRSVAGSGLGLSISREIVERMGGAIGVDSTPGAGSVFWFQVPLRLGETHPTISRPRAPAGARALVAAGHESLRSTATTALTARGFIVDEVSTDSDAEARLRAGEHDIAILIDDPPDLDARVLLARLMSATGPTATRLVFVESVGRPLDVDEVQYVGATQCPKPLWSARLDDLVSEHLSSESQSNLRAAPARPDAAGAFVLIVDDSPVNAEVASLVLATAGYRIDIARDGEEALEKVRERAYDLVLLDCQLPGLDGYDTARLLRAREREGKLPGERPTPIIALTASATSEDVQRSLEAGMNDHVTKPFAAPRLLQVVASHLRASERAAAAGVWKAPRTRPAIGQDAALARLNGDPALLRRAARRFLEVTPETWALVRAAVTRRDLPAIRFAAHRLRGQASTFDAVSLVEAVEKIERIVHEQGWSDVEIALASTQRELDDVFRALGGLAREAADATG